MAGTNVITLENAAIPAHVAARIGKESKLSVAMAGGISAGAVPRISIKGGRFRIVEDGNETPLETFELNVVVVGANPRLSKIFYIKQWAPDQEPTSPDCWSFDAITPDPSSTAVQSTTCAGCLQNAWGSKTTPNGQQIKACADQKRLAVVAFEDVGGPIYLLQVPPASLRPLNVYHKELSRRSIPPEVVATRITFDTDASHPKLTFGFGGFLTAEQQAIVDKLFGSDAVLDITGEKPILLPDPAVLQPKVTVATAPVTPIKPVQAAMPIPPIPTAKAATPPPAAPAAAPEKKRGFGTAAPTVVPPKPAAQPAASSVVVSEGLGDLERDIEAMIRGTPDDAGTTQPAGQ